MSDVIIIKGMEEVQRLFGLLGYPKKLLARAVNKGVNKSRTEAWARVKPKYNVNQKLFYRYITMFHATEAKPTGMMSASRSPFNWVDLGAKQEALGVMRGMMRGKVRLHEHEFVQKKSVVIRKWRDENPSVPLSKRTAKQWHAIGKKNKEKENPYFERRFPTVKRKPFSAAQMIDDPPEIGSDEVAKVGYEAFQKELMRQIDLAGQGKVAF